MNQIKNFIYKMLVKNKLSSIVFSEIPVMLNEHGAANKLERAEKGMFINSDDTFKFFVDDNEGLFIFYHNVCLNIQETDEKFYAAIHLKTSSDVWNIASKNESVLSSTNTCIVYCKYDILVMGYNHCYDEYYVDGAWNEYLYDTITDLDESIKSVTPKYVINNSYIVK